MIEDDGTEAPSTRARRGRRGRPRSGLPLWIGLGLVAVLAVAVAAVLWQTRGPEPVTDEPDDVAEAEPAEGDTDWDDVHDDLGVSPADLERRWNEAVEAVGAGYRLDGPTEATSGSFGLPARAYDLELGRAELVLTPEGERVVRASIDQATPAGPQQATDLLATAGAALSAATGLSPEEAGQRLEADLGMSEERASTDHHNEVARVEGFTVGLFVAHGTWSFYVEKEAEGESE